jgi:3D (Asp-Asp-Asp) domain-containing protein
VRYGGDSLSHPCRKITKGLSSGVFIVSLAAGALSLDNDTGSVLADSGRTGRESERAATEKSRDEDSRDSTAETRPLRANASKQPDDEQRLAPIDEANLSKTYADSEEASFEDFHATAYCLKGRTATGIPVVTGMIAADPRVLPLGTLVHIKAGTYTGTYKVQDTGYHIKGNRVDIYVANRAEAIRFGRRRIKLRVVNRVWRVHKK